MALETISATSTLVRLDIIQAYFCSKNEYDRLHFIKLFLFLCLPFFSDRYSYIASAALFPSLLAALLLAACSNPANAPLSAQITEENPQDPAKVRKPSAIRATLGILFGFLCALLCFTSAPAFASFRSDVRHYSRVLGWHRNRAFPHYLLGLGHQRAAERSEAKNEPSSFEDSHRQAIKALTAAERFAPGWLNLAAARAESYTALQQHERAGMNWSLFWKI